MKQQTLRTNYSFR